MHTSAIPRILLVLTLAFAMIVSLSSCQEEKTLDRLVDNSDEVLPVGNEEQFDLDAYIATATGEEYWNAILEKYRLDDAVQQILLVKYHGGSSAITDFYTKSNEGNTRRNLVFEDSSFIGSDGAGQTSSYGATTPIGDHAITEAFGICSNHGTALDSILVTNTVCGSCECSRDCPYFNEIHDVAQNGHYWCSGEHMIEYSPDYDYGSNFDYNSEKDFDAGSAFFVHCKSYYPYTGDCIALDYSHMITAIQMGTSGMRIVINYA